MKKLKYLASLANLALVVWAGATWVVGYLVAPLLFAHFPRVLAGEAVGVLLNGVYVLGLCCAVLMLLDMRLRLSKQLHLQRELWWLIGMVFLLVVQYAGLTPLMADLKAQSLVNPAMAADFSRWHAVSEVLYLAQSLMLLVLVWRKIR